MLLLRRALQQARADQLAGMCADCGGDPNDHVRGCDQFTEAWDDASPIADLKPHDPPEDPLAILLRQPVPEAAELTDDAAMVSWLIIELAKRLLDVSDREAMLRTIVISLRKRAKPSERDLVDRAAEHVQYALTRSLAS